MNTIAIRIENLSKTYENGVRALKNVSMGFKKNKITGLVGFNGSGKTTTFNILANFIENYQGKIFFDEKLFNKKKANINQISYLSATKDMKSFMSVLTHLLIIAKIYKLPKNAAITKINELAKILDFSQYVNFKIRSLSKGNQQKMRIISCFLNPQLKYLLLDEPFDGLDPIIVKKIVMFLKDLKDITIVITSHRIEIIDRLCDEFFLLKDGKVIDSRKIDNKIIVIEVNKEVQLDDIKNKIGVLDIIFKPNHNFILIKDVSFFKEINGYLIKKKNYIYSSIKSKDLPTSIFENYENKQ